MELQARDLRIGNLVLYDNQITKIESIRKGNTDFLIGLKDYDDLKFLKDIQPIPITEEWLLKLGFELTANTLYTKRFDLKDNMKIGYIFHKANPKETGMRFIGHIFNDKKYVHELQNLVYYLTGNELKL
ncbi:MAG: hypothetical protein KGV59_06305 [Tenacibaculum sp.]|nr:hypothetical protein [Tenacibaculum sp.]